MYESLWTTMTVGRIELANRLVMAPMTRDRSTPEGVPTPENAEYYAQRASLGLIVSEGTQPSADGQGYLLTPGIYSDDQVAGWALVVDAVHAAGGRLYIQLMHVGRVAHPDNTPHGRQPVAPSAVAAEGEMVTMAGPKPMPEPRSLDVGEIAQVVRDYAHAAACAVAAGADGVEIHGANGYLVQQFLAENSNHRTDGYGGSIENRCRFAIEVAAAVVAEIGADRTGIRISPGGTFNDIVEDDPRALYGYLVPELARLGLAYLHVLHAGDEELLHAIRAAWPTSLIVNRAGRPREQIAVDVENGTADAASVGAFALANPDLVERLKRESELNEPDPDTFYGGDGHGYTDYPALTAAE